MVTFPPELGQRIHALAHDLPDDRVEALGDIIDGVLECGVASAVAVYTTTWERVLAHLPELAALLEQARAHVEAPSADSPQCQPSGR
jgi:hypothetical protein